MAYPIAFDEERGQAAVDAVGATGDFAALLNGAAGSSPFLASVIAKEPEFAARIASRST